MSAMPQLGVHCEVPWNVQPAWMHAEQLFAMVPQVAKLIVGGGGGGDGGDGSGGDSGGVHPMCAG